MRVTEIEGLGAASQVPKPGRADATKLGLSAEEGFVLSRVDGHTSLADICLLVPFELAQTSKILQRLWLDGAFDLPGKERPKAAPPPREREATPVADEIDLSAEQRVRIDDVYQALESRDAFELLEVGRDADGKDIKRAYFRLSKEFHPDRYYKKEIGVYKERITKVFQAIKAAFEMLSDENRRRAYLEGLKG